MEKKPNDINDKYKSIAHIEDFDKRVLTEEELEEFVDAVVEKTERDLAEREDPPENNVIFWRSNRLL